MLKNIKNIAVINLGYIGDVVISSCVTNELRNNFPEAKITYITIPRSKGIAPYIGGIDEVVIFDKDNEQKGLKMLPWVFNFRKNHTIDLVILLNETFRSGMLGFLTGARYRVGHDSEGRGWMLTHSVPWLNEEKNFKIHISKIYMKNLEAIKIKPEKFDFKLNIFRADEDSMFKKLTHEGYNNEILIGLCPCAGFKCKDWQVDEAKKFIDYINTLPDHKVVIVGVKEAQEFAEKIRALGT
ncbi:MAG: glycosyltransferase family 9 protein, partial [Candidatus Gastranaerophilales bacterium]|nr:glycosyltransferase family 9 protein [Candidatus Gastranaerophilales bacterium]